jgi:hypothetical protein
LSPCRRDEYSEDDLEKQGEILGLKLRLFDLYPQEKALKAFWDKAKLRFKEGPSGPNIQDRYDELLGKLKDGIAGLDPKKRLEHVRPTRASGSTGV